MEELEIITDIDPEDEKIYEERFKVLLEDTLIDNDITYEINKEL